GRNTTAFARLEDPIGRRFRSARKPRVSACPMTIELEIFGWKFVAAGTAASGGVLQCPARGKAEDSMDPKAEWTRTRRMKRSEIRSAASHSATAREDARKMQFRLHSGYDGD